MSDRPKVLAVDDSATIRKAMELVLDPSEYELELAASGSEAVAKAKEFQPSVILLDFILPDMRGADVCQKLSEDSTTATIPIVLISAKGAEIRQAYDNIPSVVSYITKPFTPAGVTSVIDEAISSTIATDVVEEEVEAPVPPQVAEPTAPQPPQMANGADVEEEEDEAAWDREEVEIPAPQAAPRMGRDRLEAMFETLRSSLEGVFVEEGDTRGGATADASRSHHELAARLEQQVRETLSQAEAGSRYNLCSDGSIRSLDDSLLDAFRRFCRLLFRAAGDGAVQNDLMTHNEPRVMFVCAESGELIERFKSIAQEKGDAWETALVSSSYRQLPLMARVFGPTHLVIEAVPGGAIWDQVEAVKQLPGAQRLKVIGVAVEGAREGISDREVFGTHEIDTVVGAGAALPHSLDLEISPSAGRSTPVSPAPQAGEAATASY